jgi:hypothetical protein
MEFYYRKANARVVSSLEGVASLEVTNVQNYIPIYQKFLKLNETNYNGVVLNSQYELTKILKPQYNCEGEGEDDGCDPHYVVGEVKMNKDKRNSNSSDTAATAAAAEKNIFIKFSPLLDPIKYLSGKYDITDSALMALPHYDSTNHTCHSKVLDCNNSAYVDGFFTYLSSQVMHAHKFCHGIEYYGAYIGHKQNFEVNITDDVECFHECSFFKMNKDVIYSMDSNSEIAYENNVNYLYNDACNTDINASMRTRKPRLVCKSITADDADIVIATDVLDDAIHTLFDPVTASTAPPNETFAAPEAVLTYSIQTPVSGEDDINNGDKVDNRSQASASTNSSRSSNSTQCEGEEQCEICDNVDNSPEGCDDDDDDNSCSDDSCSDEDDEIFVQIKSFPVNMILMEECDDTLDSLLDDGVILSTDEWSSILMQIIMTLVAYQKMFWFTHNDLHTNNVMFVETDKPYLYYLYEGKHYRVPTYGKLFKIIDFGRAVYKYKSLTICSDSFHPKGDAATQYNFEPYMNKKKPCLEPNPSFDLCRLACSLFDYFINDVGSAAKLSKSDPIIALVAEWVKDDKGRNVLYKSSGEERYPNFKLYKMIARTVHNHVPAAQLKNPLFSKYVVLGSEISQKVKKTGLISIDDMPEYYSS